MANIISTNPGRAYEILGEVTVSSGEEIKDKVKKAKQAGESWGTLQVSKRILLLRKLIDKFQENKEELALIATKEMGMPLTDNRNDIDNAMRYFSWYLDNAEN